MVAMTRHSCSQFVLSVGRYPCSSLGWFKNTVLASYGSGHLRLYSADTGGLHVEATAHGKWITAVDVAHSNGLVSSNPPPRAFS